MFFSLHGCPCYISHYFVFFTQYHVFKILPVAMCTIMILLQTACMILYVGLAWSDFVFCFGLIKENKLLFPIGGSND